MTQPGSPSSAMPAGEDSTLRRIADLERQVRELAPSIADSFNSTAASLADTLANQVTPAVARGSASSFSLSTGYAGICSASVAVPTGYTRALVFASGALTGITGSSSGDRLYSYIDIAGSAGAESAGVITTYELGTSLAVVHSVSLSSLTSGATLTALLSARFLVGPNTSSGLLSFNRANVAVQALFMR